MGHSEREGTRGTGAFRLLESWREGEDQSLGKESAGRH